jgi:pimeloyl-ACP methyl ester carboxylesterase
VFQHGLCGDAAQPAEVFPDDAAFRRVTLECRGHGSSDPGDAAELSIATFTDDLVAAIEGEAFAPCVVGGISMGAAIALRLAVTRPDLVRALVLARPAWLTEPAPPNMRPYFEVGELLSRFAAEEARDRFEASATAAWLKREGPDNLASLRTFFDRKPQAVTAACLMRIAADGPNITAAEIARLRLPALVIGHGCDPLHPWSYAERLAAMLPEARLVRITAKAESRNRYVEDFRAALRRFLTELTALTAQSSKPSRSS